MGILDLKLNPTPFKFFYNLFHKHARSRGVAVVEFFYFSGLTAEACDFHGAWGAFRDTDYPDVCAVGWKVFEEVCKGIKQEVANDNNFICGVACFGFFLDWWKLVIFQFFT